MSTMKVPQSIELLGRVDSRTVSHDQTCVIKNTFPPFAKGTPLSLDYASDSGVSLYDFNASR